MDKRMEAVEQWRMDLGQGKDGVIPYGLNQIEGTWRYIDPNTGYMRVGFIDVYSGGRTYAKDGVIYPGWQTVGGKQYYIDPNTRLFVTGWQMIDGQKYYFNISGEMQKGMQPIGGYWYYLDEETGALWTSGWEAGPERVALE
ncbi:MAG: N-acetylmuramoyl-L-alanine amidase family protein [Ruthenibacterium lactatiformans]